MKTYYSKEDKYSKKDKYIKAKKRVDNLKGFYANIIAYCIVIPFLIFINLMTSPDHLWFWYPMIGWGIGIIFHAVGVFNKNIFLGEDWEERKIQEYMNEEDKQNWE